MSKDVVMEFWPDGKRVTVEAQGFKGKGCHAATAPYEKELGLTDLKRKAKPEANEVEATPTTSVTRTR